MRALSNVAIDAALGLATAAGRAWMAFPPLSDATLERNLAYGPDARHRVDVYTPARPRGIHVLYIHGGSFRTCSKESHTFVGRTLAKRGVHVYAIDYGLAPAYAYPVAHRDAFLAYRWMLERHAGTGRVVTAGDSAGGNVALSLAVAASGGFEPALVTDLDGLRAPDAVLCCSGLLRVQDSARAYTGRQVVRDRLAQIEHDFLAGHPDPVLAEPLRMIEQAGPAQPWVHALPRTFIAVGDRDPIARDSHDLARALDPARRELATYPGEGHAFMVSPFRRSAARCWCDADAFLEADHP